MTRTWGASPGTWCRRALLGAVLAVLTFPAAPRLAAAEESLPADLALVPRDESAFVTVRFRDLMAGELSKVFFRALGTAPGMLPYLLRDVGVPVADVERLTFLPDAGITIVRTARPYDRDKLLANFGVKGKPREHRGKAIYLGRRAVYLAGERVYVTAPPFGSLQTLLDRLARKKAGEGPLQKPLAAAAGKHHLVVGFNPAGLAIAMSPRAVRATAEKASGPPPSPPAKEDKPPRKEAPRPPPVADRPEKDEHDVPANVQAMLRELPAEALPYKPLLQVRYAVVTADVGEESRLAARLVYPDKGLTRDAETAVKTTLYVARQMLSQFFERVGLGDSGKTRLALPRQLRAALRDAVVRTDGDAVTVAVRVKIDAAEAARLAAELRRRAVRQESSNNLRQIGLAMINLADSHGGNMAPAAIYGADGKPLLSWRVAILPYIEHGALYNQFKLDEPWDSPHNKKLLAKMPRTFASPDGKGKKSYTTYYQVFVGPKAPFQLNFDPKVVGFKSRGPRFPASFLDGTSNTFLVVEAATAVPWTKPADIPFDPKKPLPKLGGIFADGFHAAFADGLVRFLRKDLDKTMLRRLIMPADGEIIDWKKVDPEEARTRRFPGGSAPKRGEPPAPKRPGEGKPPPPPPGK